MSDTIRHARNAISAGFCQPLPDHARRQVGRRVIRRVLARPARSVGSQREPVVSGSANPCWLSKTTRARASCRSAQVQAERRSVDRRRGRRGYPRGTWWRPRLRPACRGLPSFGGSKAEAGFARGAIEKAVGVGAASDRQLARNPLRFGAVSPNRSPPPNGGSTGEPFGSKVCWAAIRRQQHKTLAM